MTREQALIEAIDAATKAKALASKARDAAYETESPTRTSVFATASGAWADVARSYTDIAAQLGNDERPLVIAVDEASLLLGAVPGTGKSDVAALLSVARNRARHSTQPED
ncbi:hypothetical protein AB0C13_22230 [Streptomyces sp. NPDC049099]|uniref:hypothetical protein n=1 Tax=Streptomyces sp. NPDC049099 TaxID=3155768 RepID=UPI003426C668